MDVEKQSSLFFEEFQKYLITQFKHLPIPKSYLVSYQKKAKTDPLHSLEDPSFWQNKEEKFQKQLFTLFSLILPKEEVFYTAGSIPKTQIPLCHALVSRKEFADPLALFAILLDKRFSKIYAEMDIPCIGPIGCFTWVMPDGFGDWIALKRGIEILKKSMPNLIVKALCFYESSWKELLEDTYLQTAPLEEKIHFVSYSKEKPSLSHAALALAFQKQMHGIKWLLQFPTYYVGFLDLLQKRPLLYESLGQYGFLLAPFFSPAGSGKSMGLHPLEVGVLLMKKKAEAPKKEYLSTLYPYDQIALAYLKTEKGAITYLFLLAALQRRFSTRIAILMPTFASLKERWKEEEFMRELSVFVKGKILFSPKEGKSVVWGEGEVVLQVVEIGSCTEEEFYALAQVSTLPIGCRGDQSFTEAVSLKKPFFYDPPAHAENFLIDLARFASFFTSSKSLTSWIESSSKVLGDDNPSQIALELANLYPDLHSLAKDFVSLGEQIEKHANGNIYLRGRMKRSFVHSLYPKLYEEETALYSALPGVMKRGNIDQEALKAWDESRKRFEITLSQSLIQ